MPTLIALAGGSRTGKGTAASVIRRKATENGFSVVERQLSGPGKQYVASAFRSDITEAEAIEWFEEMKKSKFPARVIVEALEGYPAECTLQEYLQRMLQGARERWGDSFWTDKLLPTDTIEGEDDAYRIPRWPFNFVPAEAEHESPPDLCLISDLRQDNEADRVHELDGWVFECFRPDHDDPYVTSREYITERGLSPGKADFVMHSNGDLDYWIGIWEAACEDHILPQLDAQLGRTR